jgi:hypothetical protein
VFAVRDYAGHGSQPGSPIILRFSDKLLTGALSLEGDNHFFVGTLDELSESCSDLPTRRVPNPSPCGRTQRLMSRHQYPTSPACVHSSPHPSFDQSSLK